MLCNSDKLVVMYNNLVGDCHLQIITSDYIQFWQAIVYNC
jgi:hypothetical protein